MKICKWCKRCFDEWAKDSRKWFYQEKYHVPCKKNNNCQCKCKPNEFHKEIILRGGKI